MGYRKNIPRINKTHLTQNSKKYHEINISIFYRIKKGIVMYTYRFYVIFRPYI